MILEFCKFYFHNSEITSHTNTLVPSHCYTLCSAYMVVQNIISLYRILEVPPRYYCGQNSPVRKASRCNSI